MVLQKCSYFSKYPHVLLITNVHFRSGFTIHKSLIFKMGDLKVCPELRNVAKTSKGSNFMSLSLENLSNTND